MQSTTVTRWLLVATFLILWIIAPDGPNAPQSVPTTTAAATATPTPPCSPEQEHMYEIIRFAQHSHVPWLERALQHEPGSEIDDDVADPEFQQWWIDQYEDVLLTLSAECVPSLDYPNLPILPGQWESYPTRAAAAQTANR